MLFRSRDRIPCHARELILKSWRHIHVAREQDFMHRAVVAGEIADKTFDHLSRKSTALEQSTNIKQVAWMLAIHRGDEFAAVKF